MPGGGPGWFPEQVVVGKRRAGLFRVREMSTSFVCLQGTGRAVLYYELQNIQAAVNDDKIRF